MNWPMALLKSDPFRIEAPTESLRAVWADMESVKKKLEGVISTAFWSGVTQVVLNRGPWGAGKTHAAVYFSDPGRLREASSFTGRIACVYTRMPKDPDQGPQEFYEQVLEQLSWDAIRQWVQTLHQSLGEEEALKRLHSFIQDADLSRIVWLLGKPEYDLYLLRRYLTGTLARTAKELPALRVAKAIRPGSGYHQVAVLAAVLKAAVGFEDGLPSGRVFIWIDETEDLIFYPERRKRAMTNVWRDLVDRLPQGLALFLNYTPGRVKKGGDVRFVFGEALVSRFTQVIGFEPLSEEDAFTYVKGLMNDPKFRLEDPVARAFPATYPFEEGMVKVLLSKLSNKTPRNINLACGEILRGALREDTIQKVGDFVTTSYLEEKWPDLEALLRREEGLED